MVSKKNFLQNGFLTQQRFTPYNKKFFRTPLLSSLSTSHMLMRNYNQIFSVSQIPDNPGYMDFNLPTPQYDCVANNGTKSVTVSQPSSSSRNSNVTPNANGDKNRNINAKENATSDSALVQDGRTTENNLTASSSTKAPQSQSAPIAVKKKTVKIKQKGKQQLHQHKVGWRSISQQQQQQQQTKHIKKLYNRNNVHFQLSRIGLSRQFKNRKGGGGGEISDRSVMPSMTVLRPGILRGSLSRPLMNKSSLSPRTFQQPNIFPPIPPPMVRQLQPPLRFMRRGNGPMLPIRPYLPSMRMTRNISSPLSTIPISDSGGTVVPKIVKNFTKGKSTIKTLKNLINQYPMEKPWVTSEIRAEYNKKIDIEERLKGYKNDDLFAQFKIQRDKFVSMYETARDEFIKQEAAAVKAKKSLQDAKDKQAKATTTNKNALQKDSK